MRVRRQLLVCQTLEIVFYVVPEDLLEYERISVIWCSIYSGQCSEVHKRRVDVEWYETQSMSEDFIMDYRSVVPYIYVLYGNRRHLRAKVCESVVGGRMTTRAPLR